MKFTRRETLTAAIGSAGALASQKPHVAQAKSSFRAKSDCLHRPTWAAGIEGQRLSDQGNGTFLNPVLAGDRPDPNVLKDGKDYYVTFSSFQYYPGIPIWHSRDLVNWTPLTTALQKNIGIVWALDIAEHDGRYFIYIPVLDTADGKRPLKTFVVHAAAMIGPWSDPIDMQIDGFIDPGHAVGEDGKRYLFFNGGHRVRLSDDGLSAIGKPEHVYDGWPIPEDFVIEGFALEGPKILRKDGWFYLFSGQGGTAGPPTSHMVVAARSRSIHGPWENAPNNPIVRTKSRDEPWWSRGHATPIQGPAGDWWLVYHAYENGYRSLGRQMILEPFDWTADGWPVARGGDLSEPIRKPMPASKVGHGVALSEFTDTLSDGKFASFSLSPNYAERISISRESLRLRGQGAGPADSSPLLFVAPDRSYEITVDVEFSGRAQGGLLLFYNEKLFAGLGLSDGKLHAYRIGQEERWPPGGPASTNRILMRVRNSENVATFFYSVDGKRWKKERSVEVSGYNHNVADGFLSLRPGFFASGTGEVTFRSLRYRAIKSDDGLLRSVAVEQGMPLRS